MHAGAQPDAPALVLIHGAGGTHLHWPPDIRRLAGYTIYALDLPGHGKSSGPGEQSIEAYAEKVAGWMAAIGLDRAVLVGHSMGAAIALQLGIDHSAAVRAMVLLGGGVRLRVNPDLLEQAASSTTLPLALNAIVAWSYSPQADAKLVELAGQRIQEIRPSVLHGDLLACDAFDVKDEVGRVRAPALVLCGQDDRMTPLRLSQFLAGSLPGAQFQAIPEAGHMVMLEQPAEVTRVLKEFLNQIL
jgi:pimeloyl-ACP methyl ester carboxylesterase